MNKQELIEEIKQSNEVFPKMPVLYLIEQLDEPQPLKLKDIISRMKQLFPLSRSEWIDEIKKEFGEEFCLWKYKAGYEQGKLEGIVEREKVTIPQFVAQYIEWSKGEDFHLLGSMNRENFDNTLEDWFYTDDNMELFARAWLDGYEVEEEKRYYVRLKNVDENYNYLNHIKHLDAWCLTEIKTDKKFRITHTRKQLEDAGFGEVFNSTLFEVEEVE